MPLSYAHSIGDGLNRNFDVPCEYLSKTHVTVRVDGVEVPFTWVDTYRVQTATAPAKNAIVEVRRVTPRVDRMVTFNDGSTLVETDLNVSTLQSFFLSQEAFDQGAASMAVTEDGQFSALTRRITAVADPINAQDVATRNFVETSMTSQVVQARQSKDDAATARTGAQTARTNAESAQVKAETAQSKSEQAKAKSEMAQAKAEQAQAASEGARDAAQGHMNAALGHANNASSSASTAATKAAEAAASADRAALFDPKSYYTRTQIDETTGLLAPKRSPAFEGSPTAPKPAKGDKSSRIANTEFVAEMLLNAQLPVGTTIMMQGNGATPPPGFLLHNGAPCTAAYPDLRDWLLANGARTNGAGDPIIEDMGGYFPRGWRAGQIVDSGREFGSVQQDALQNITGSLAGRNEYYGNDGTGALYRGPEVAGARADGNGGPATRSIIFDASRVARTSHETRPVNKTFTYWIKAYAVEQVPGSVEFAQLQNNLTSLQVRADRLEGRNVTFASSNQSYTVGALGAVAHGLPARPNWLAFELVCVKADNGYDVGDYLEVGSGSCPWSGQGHFGLMYWSTSTTVNWKVAGQGILIINKTGGGNVLAPSASWQLRARAGL